MELRHLRYFLMVAEELHITRAAQRLGMSQPPLSLQIRQLEEEVGTPLFLRLGRGVALTEAGKAFAARARIILTEVETALSDARRAGRGETGSLRLGLSGSTPFDHRIASLVRRYRSAYPEVTLAVEELASSALIDKVRDSSLDAALVLEPLGLGGDLLSEQLLCSSLMAVLPADHPATGNDSLSLERLAGEGFVMIPRHVGPGLYDATLMACRDAGFSPRVVQESVRTSTAVQLVGAGVGVALVPAWLSHIGSPATIFRSLAQPRPIRVAIVHHPNRVSTALRNMLRLSRSIAKDEDWLR
jgi:DNA-binding transcriptional LysR family regulator